MSKIDTNCIVKKSIDDFIIEDFTPNPKPVIFWDTCALLDIVRFLYKECDNANETIKSIRVIEAKVLRGEVYSVASTIEINEWNDNEAKAINFLSDNLQRTTNYHKKTIDVINNINNTGLLSEQLINHNLEHNLVAIAENILHKTIFLDEDKQIAYDALKRTKLKEPPAGAKEEFKDCAIWESMLNLSERIDAVDDSIKRVFYTTNTQDFCEKNNPDRMLYQLTSESITKNFSFCIDITKAKEALI